MPSWSLHSQCDVPWVVFHHRTFVAYSVLLRAARRNR